MSKGLANGFSFASLLSGDRGCLEAVGSQAWLVVSFDSRILSVISSSVSQACVKRLGMWVSVPARFCTC